MSDELPSNIEIILFDAVAFVETILPVLGFSVDMREQFYENRQPVIRTRAFDRVVSTWDRLRKNIPKKKRPFITDSRFKTAINIYASQQAAVSLQAFRNEWVLIKENLEPARRFARALVGFDCETTQAVLFHWLSNVKRKILGLPVKDHILPVLYGHQGCGKSVAIRHLISPLNEYSIELTSLDELTDERRYEIYASHYIAFCDEFVRGGKNSLDGIKAFLTREANTYRPMYSHGFRTVAQNCSVIGATDKPLAWQINDPQGARRFYEIACSNPIDWGGINSIEYLELWKGIDENRDYLKGFREDLKAAQKALEIPDPIIEFLKEYAIGPASSSGTAILVSDMYKLILRFCLENGFDLPKTGIIGRSLAIHGIRSSLHRGDDKQPRRHYFIAPGHRLMKGGNINTMHSDKHLSLVKNMDSKPYDT